MSSVDLNNLSIEDLKKIEKGKKTKLKKEFNEYKQQQEKQKLVHEIMGIEKPRKKIMKAKSTPKPKSKLKHLMIIFRNLSKARRFQKTHQLTSKELLKEQWGNIKFEWSMKN